MRVDEVEWRSVNRRNDSGLAQSRTTSVAFSEFRTAIVSRFIREMFGNSRTLRQSDAVPGVPAN
jgi:hypothetical protein